MKQELIPNQSGSGIKNKRITIGISSGIAGYKVLDLIDLFKRDNFEVDVIMTKHAVEMFGVSDFEKKTGRKVYSEIILSGFSREKILEKRKVDHIEIADNTDIFVIIPATANIIGKLAHGIADDFLTTTVLATSAPLVICPSMNSHMWENSVVAENLSLLEKRGYVIIEPDTGDLACGYNGKGRLPEVRIIKGQILRIFEKGNTLKGKKVIVTAGASIEPIDGVRMITNLGTGKMGKEIADECVKRGAEVLMLKSATSNVKGMWQEEKLFTTVADLGKLIAKYTPFYNVIFHSASVSDFTPEVQIKGKKESSKELLIKLKPTSKIINIIKDINPKILLVGFKAVFKEPEKKLIKTGIAKMKDSRADFIIVNDVGKKDIGFGADDNEVYIMSSKGLKAKILKSPKKIIAEKIVDYTLSVSGASPGLNQ